MAWTQITRKKYARKTPRYASDIRDEEWALIELLLPARHKGRGRPRKTDLREVINGLLYMATTGCQWRQIPKDFPAFTTLQNYFYQWSRSQLWMKINHTLVMNPREKVGREASPTAGVIDSQTVKTCESGGLCGYDGGQENQGSQTAYCDGYRRQHGGNCCASGG